MAFDLIDAAQEAFEDPSLFLKQRRMIKFKIGLHLGDNVASVMVGNIIKKFNIVGKAINDLEFLCLACPSNKIMMSEAFKNNLPNNFRYSYSSALPQIGKHVYYLDSKDDHQRFTVTSMAAMATACERFKNHKNKSHTDPSINDTENDFPQPVFTHEEQYLQINSQSQTCTVCSPSGICRIL